MDYVIRNELAKEPRYPLFDYVVDSSPNPVGVEFDAGSNSNIVAFYIQLHYIPVPDYSFKRPFQRNRVYLSTCLCLSPSSAFCINAC